METTNPVRHEQDERITIPGSQDLIEINNAMFVTNRSL